MNKHLRKFLLLLPCLLLHPEGSRAITVDIPAGEVVSGGDVHSVVTQRVYGEADNFTVSGKQQVMSGGVTRNSNIYPYGQQDVLQNGISYGTVVQQYAVQNVDGRAYSSSVGSYGTIDVNAGGYAEDTSVDGGSFFVSSGGTAEGTVIASGHEYISGTDNNAKVSGGLASDTKIHGGIQTVFSGGISRNTEADGGLIVLHSGGIMSGITKITDGILNVAGTNNISDLELKNALVTIIKEPGFSQLQIDKLDGSGIFSISSNLAQSEADHLDIGGGNGNFGLIVHDYSADGNLPAEFKLIDETSSAADNFYLVGNAVDVGAFRYNLQHDGDDWVLHRTQEHTDSSLIAKNTYSSLASLFYTHLNPLYNRFRMKHKRTGKDDGLWIKGIGREIKFRYKDQTKSNMKIYGAEIGYDREIWHNGGKGLQLGLYGGTSDSRQKYDRGGHGDGETQSLGVYSTLSTADNWFVDVVGTYFWHTQKIKSYTPSGSDVNGKYDANAWQFSAFVGKRWDIAESWFVEPYMGLNYMRVDGIDYRTNFNTRVSASAADYLGGSIGVSGGKEFVLADGTVFDAYGRFSLMHDWDGKSPVTVADEIFAEDTSSLRYELGAGIAAAWNETNSAYFEASTQLGSSVRFPWEINIGIQFNF